MKRKTRDEFISQSRSKYGPGKYDYNRTNYTKNSIKVSIRCIVHDLVFEQTPGNHLNFEGCPECYRENQKAIFSKSQEQFIIDAKKVHGEKYNYSKTQYTSILEKVKVICPDHGEFLVYPTNHLKGCDCKKCGHIKIPGGYFNKFFERFPEKKNNPAILYFYKFTRISDGSFFFKLGISTKIKTRYSSKDYAAFVISKIWEVPMTLFTAWNYEQILSKIFVGNKYTPPEDFNGKTECYSSEIPLPNFLNIFGHEWKNKKEIIASRINIKNKLNPSTIVKIPGRKTCVELIDNKRAAKFLEETHIQGTTNQNKISLGLFFENKLVSVMTFGKPRYTKDYKWELLRFSNSLNTIVVGGASKLFSFFVKQYSSSDSIISYSDNRWNKGSVYEQIGMKFSHSTTPNYWYIKGNEVLSRITCQKHKLSKLLKEFNPNETELQNMINNGFTKIKDNGNNVYVFNPKA